jgi:hypothetical protein
MAIADEFHKSWFAAMTVRELIARLEQMPPDAKVFYLPDQTLIPVESVEKDQDRVILE